jgi:hypothetical protein
MDRLIVGERPFRSARLRGVPRADLAMSVLQYGTAIVAIAAVTLLALAR